jgi:MFS family permease
VIIRREVHETPAFSQSDVGDTPQRLTLRSPVAEAFQNSWKNMGLVTCMALMNVIPVVATVFGAAYAVQPAYGVEFSKGVYLWIPVVGNLVAVLVIPFVGNWSDTVGRRPMIISGALGAGVLSVAYLYAISLHSVPWAFALSILMWGVVYQGYNAVFPSFYPELFQTRYRVSAMAISQNLGTMVTALLPALFAAVAPPGSDNIPLTVGSIAMAVTLVAALAAYSAHETYRVPMHALGTPNAKAMGKAEYDALRAEPTRPRSR